MDPAPRPLRTALFLVLLVSLPGALAPGAEATDKVPASSAPNFLVILTDDLRWDCLGSSGNRVVRTPNLDRFAADAARFEQFYVTTPLCSPSRATLLTGHYGREEGIGLIQNRAWIDFGSDTETLATHLNRVDYRTAFVGKAHLGGDPRSWGFQDTTVWLPNGSTMYDDPQLQVRGHLETVEGNITEIFVHRAIRFLRSKATDGVPFLLYLSTTAPHGPYCCQERFPYFREEIEQSPPPGLPPGTPLSAFDWTSYYSTISDLDEQLGRIFTELEALGVADNTYVLFVSDNGLMSGSHGIDVAKGLWYQESVRVPALLSGPGIPSGTVTQPASIVDLLPTLLELGGLPVPSGLPGTSLVPALLDGETTRQAVFLEAQSTNVPHWQAVISFDGPTSGFKYVREVDSGREILYDIRTDPFELLDLFEQGAPPVGIVNTLRGILDGWVVATQ